MQKADIEVQSGVTSVTQPEQLMWVRTPPPPLVEVKPLSFSLYVYHKTANVEVSSGDTTLPKLYHPGRRYPARHRDMPAVFRRYSLYLMNLENHVWQ